ncbi:sirohydrochlorin chelatase, partial [Paenarthrobacter nicotinovorans]|uniref:sirohydrochlorin chelatase n=1 Tax=Paenarthrobacter nicotinovorans TaxID=29320 RepID=UPI0024863CD2
MNSPVLIACAHGTRNAEGQAAIRRVMAEIEELRPGLQVLEAYVDVQEPELSGVVEGLPEGTAAVVVPLLLSTGFHIKVDVPKAIKSRPEVVAASNDCDLHGDAPFQAWLWPAGVSCGVWLALPASCARTPSRS